MRNRTLVDDENVYTLTRATLLCLRASCHTVRDRDVMSGISASLLHRARGRRLEQLREGLLIEEIGNSRPGPDDRAGANGVFAQGMAQPGDGEMTAGERAFSIR